jgi:hypothetical protein
MNGTLQCGVADGGYERLDVGPAGSLGGAADLAENLGRLGPVPPGGWAQRRNRAWLRERGW